jgi:hypothetical protein
VIAGDNPPADLVAPGLMLAFGLYLLGLGVRLWSGSSADGVDRFRAQ